MNSRDRVLTILLAGFIVVMVLGVIGYVAVYLPIANMNKDIAALEKDIAEKEGRLAVVAKDAKRADDLIKRSLPEDHDVASLEYDAAINRILREARVPASVYTVSKTSVDTRPVPEMGPKKPAYHRIALRITIKPIDLATLLDVLHRYYRLNLLHQITAFSVKKIEGGSTAAARRRDSTVSDKADLDVVLTTEAIILDGAEKRRALLPIPVAMGGAGGGAGLQLLNAVPEPARGLTPQQIARVLAGNDRDYTSLLVQDPFHGPPPPPPKIEKKDFTEPPPKPKDDTSPYIRLTGFGNNRDGTGTAFIQDLASRQEYEIVVKREKTKLVATAEKFYYTGNTRKTYGAEADLDISESSSATKRLFRVVGFDDDSLILTELVDGEALTPPAPAPRPFGQPGGGGFPNGGFAPGGGFDDGFAAPAPAPKAVSRPKVPASSAVVGGAAYGLPQLKVFAWKSGTRLSEITELTGSDIRKALQRAAGPASDPTTALAGEAGR